MSLSEFIENSVVLLKDGRAGTVVYVYQPPNSSVALIEQDFEQCGHDGELFHARLEEVERVIWLPTVKDSDA